MVNFIVAAISCATSPKTPVFEKSYKLSVAREEKVGGNFQAPKIARILCLVAGAALDQYKWTGDTDL
jgi:hypothetical protein